MSISPYKTWIAGEVLTAADLNASFTQVFSNGQSLGFPRTESADFDGFELILDSDADSSITVDTDDRLDLRLQGQDVFKFDGTTATVVNGITFTASAAGSPAQITTHGNDAAVDLLIDPKSTGKVDFNGTEVVYDADADSSLRETADDILAFKLRGTDLVILDGATGGTTVNGITVQASAAGAPVQIKAQGSDATISILLDPKGAAGTVDLDGAILTLDADADSTLRETADDVIALRLQGLDAVIFDGDVASPVNGITVTSSATTVDPSIAAQGGDTHVNLRLAGKGNGVVASANGFAVDGATNLTWRIVGSGTDMLVQENTNTPTSPTWTTRNTFATGAGFTAGLQHLNSYSPAAAATVDITSQITSTYYLYLITFFALPSTDDVEFWIRTDANNGASFDAGASDYDFFTRTDAPASQDTFQSSGDVKMAIGENTAGLSVSNAAGEGIAGLIWIIPGGNAALWWEGIYIDASGATARAYRGGGQRRVTTDMNAVRLLFESGNMTGRVDIYGLSKV